MNAYRIDKINLTIAPVEVLPVADVSKLDSSEAAYRADAQDAFDVLFDLIFTRPGKRSEKLKRLYDSEFASFKKVVLSKWIDEGAGE